MSIAKFIVEGKLISDMISILGFKFFKGINVNLNP